MDDKALPAFEALAALLLGLMSGFFFAFAVDVAPAMVHLDASMYVTTQQWINKVVRNAWFALAYFGATVLPFVVAALAFAKGRRPRALAWFAIALLYFGAVFWVTRSVNVPINDELATWNPASPPASWVQARDTWNENNAVRAIASFVSFALSLAMLAIRPQRRETGSAQAGLSISTNS